VPANVVATALNCTNVNLSWTASSDTGTGVRQYNIYRDGALINIVAAPATSALDTSVSPSTAYSYSVSATDAAGNTSALSASAPVTTPACGGGGDTTPPTVPAGVTATAASCTNVSLSWTASSDAGSGVKQYNIYRNGALLTTVPAQNTSFADTTVAASTSYSYTVSATDNAGNTSAQSTATGVTTPACADTTPPTIPTGVSATAVNCTNVSVSWTASTDTGSGVKQYNVYRNGALVTVVSAQATSISDTTVAGSTSYNYTVSATDNAGNTSAQSTAAGVTTPTCADTTPPTVPTGVSATAASCTNVSVSWTSSSDAGSGVKQYNVYRNGTLIRTVLAPTTSTSDTTAAGSSSYNYSVSATDNAGNTSAQSTAAGVTTPTCADTTPPTVPTGVGATAVNCTNVSVSWTASTDTGSGVKQYNVYRNGTLIKTVLAPTTSTSDTTVAGSSSYSYTVSATDNAGNTSAQSTAAGVTTPACADTTPPTVPTGMSATAASCTQVSISWAASTDTGSGVKQYNVYRNGALLTTVAAPTTSAADTTAWGGTAYSYTVSATDNAGNTSAQSTAANVTTPVCVPSVSLTTPAGGSTVSNTISVAATASDGSGISRVEFYYDNATLIGTVTSAPYTTSFGTTTLTNGNHRFYAKAYDMESNSAVSITNAVTVNNAVGTPPPAGGTLLWTSNLTGSAVFPAGVIADHANNTVVAGAFEGSITIGGSSIMTSGGYDIYIAKYGANGALLWGKTIGGTGDDRAYAVAVDSQNNIVIAGYFEKTVNFGGISLKAYDPYNTSEPDIFVAKYSAAGNLIWVEQGSSVGYAEALAIDSGDNIIVASAFANGITESLGGITISSSNGGMDIALVKLTSAGTASWAKDMGSTGDDYAADLTVDNSGNIFLAGNLAGPANLGSGTTATGGGFIAKYNSSGTCQWTKVFVAPVNGVAADPSTGNVFATGGFSGSVDFGGGAITTRWGGGIFIAGYGASGNYLWSKAYGQSGDIGYGIATDGAGHLAIADYNAGGIDFLGTGIYTSGNFLISFTISESSAPVYEWAASNGAYTGDGIAFDYSGHVVIHGTQGGSGFTAQFTK